MSELIFGHYLLKNLARQASLAPFVSKKSLILPSSRIMVLVCRLAIAKTA